MTTFILIVLLSSEGVGIVNAGEYQTLSECIGSGKSLVAGGDVKTYTCFPLDNGSI